MKNIIFIAPPLAGKGTQSTKICDEYNIPHISTGDLLRDEIQRKTKIGLQIKENMSLGKFVPDEIITKILKKRLVEKDCKKGYVLDGYPRNISQCETYEKILEELGFPLGYVIFLNVDKSTLLSRISNRKVCPSCGASYNLSVKELTPCKDNICDRCGRALRTRSDDSEDVFLDRFNTYEKETEGLINFYKNKNVLYEIDANNKSVEEIFEEIKKVIK